MPISFHLPLLPVFPSSLHRANSPGDRAGEIWMCSVKCCCLECCPDHELCFLDWNRKAKQPFRDSGRGPHRLDVTARKTRCRASLFRPALARCKGFMSAMLSLVGTTLSFRNKSSCSELKRSLAWSGGGRTRGDTCFFTASAYILDLFSLPQSPKSHLLAFLLQLASNKVWNCSFCCFFCSPSLYREIFFFFFLGTVHSGCTTS